MSNDLFKTDAAYNVVDISEYRNRQERRKQQSTSNRKGQSKVSYLPFTFSKKIEDFPSNKELVAAGYEPISATILTKLRGRQEIEIANLNSATKVDAQGQTVSAYTSSEVLVKIILMLLQSWTLKDYETDQPLPVNEENVLNLLQEDFDYLAAQVNEALAALNPENTQEGEPQAAPTEEQKK